VKKSGFKSLSGFNAILQKLKNQRKMKRYLLIIKIGNFVEKHFSNNLKNLHNKVRNIDSNKWNIYKISTNI
jgi:hypothetical protein